MDAKSAAAEHEKLDYVIIIREAAGLKFAIRYITLGCAHVCDLKVEARKEKRSKGTRHLHKKLFVIRFSSPAEHIIPVFWAPVIS